jgi:hypothetical protein
MLLSGIWNPESGIRAFGLRDIDYERRLQAKLQNSLRGDSQNLPLGDYLNSGANSASGRRTDGRTLAATRNCSNDGTQRCGSAYGCSCPVSS